MECDGRVYIVNYKVTRPLRESKHTSTTGPTKEYVGLYLHSPTGFMVCTANFLKLYPETINLQNGSYEKQFRNKHSFI